MKKSPTDAADFAARLVDFYRLQGITGKYGQEAEEILHVLGVYAENGDLGISDPKTQIRLDHEAQKKRAIKRIVRHFS